MAKPYKFLSLDSFVGCLWVNVLPRRLEKFSRNVNIYTVLQSTSYGLQLCSTAYDNAPECSISMDKFKILWKGDTPPYRLHLTFWVHSGIWSCPSTQWNLGYVPWTVVTKRTTVDQRRCLLRPLFTRTHVAYLYNGLLLRCMPVVGICFIDHLFYDIDFRSYSAVQWRIGHQTVRTLGQFLHMVTTVFRQELIMEMRYPNVTWRIILPVYLFTTELRHTCSSIIFF